VLKIDIKSRKPIYEQIIDNIKDLIADGTWPRDTQLPSVRQLAVDLAINPNTIQKAYSELERQGIIYSLKSKGSFVASSVEDLRLVKREELCKELDIIVIELERIGLKREEIVQMILKGGGEN